MILVPVFLSRVGKSKKEGLYECLRGYTHAKDKLWLVLLVLPGSVCVFVYHRHSSKRGKKVLPFPCLNI